MKKRLGRPIGEEVLAIKSLPPPAELIPDMLFDSSLPERPLVPEDEESLFDAEMDEVEDDGGDSVFGSEAPEAILPVAQPVQEALSDNLDDVMKARQEFTELLNTAIPLTERAKLPKAKHRWTVPARNRCASNKLRTGNWLQTG